MTISAPQPAPLLFRDLAAVSAALARTRSRLEKKALLVELLRKAPPDEVAAAVGWLVAEPLHRPLGVGPASLWELSRLPILGGPPATLREVEQTLEAAGRRATSADLVTTLFEKLDASDRALLMGALTDTLRQGSLAGVMRLALAEVAGRTEGEVRRMLTLVGSITATAEALLGTEREAPAEARLKLFRPLAPMLASSSESLEEALARVPNAVVEQKIDGVRAQIHKEGTRVVIFSRQGRDITLGCAPVAADLAAIRARDVVLDAEIVLLAPDGTPRPFQDSFSAIATGAPALSVHAAPAARSGSATGAAPPTEQLHAYLFDCLYRDGVELLGEPLATRREALRAVAPADLLAKSIESTDPEALRSFYADTLRAGHEGVMVKDLASPYQAGARGRAWQKVKEATTADLVVIAVERGNGRRKGWLSNLHLGARRADGTFCMVGKTFKGLTDALLRWQTEELARIATADDGYVVRVRPERVVEIRFNEVQRSPRYPGKIALRFARVVRYRDDKTATEADTLDSLVARVRDPSDRAQGKAARQLSLFG